MNDNSKYLPIAPDEHNALHDLAVEITLGWEETPIFDSMEKWWFHYFMLKPFKELRSLFIQFVYNDGPSGKNKAAYARCLAKHFNDQVRAI